MLTARRVDRLHELAGELTAAGGRALALACDVTVDGDLERAVAAARESFRRLDVVIANAGFGVVGPVQALGLDDYRRQLETNVFGVVRTAHATLDELKKSRGRFVIIGSVSGHVGVAGSSAYSMSKFAVRGFAESLRHEMAPHGVAVTLISPGFVDSEIRRVDNRGALRDDADDPVPGWLRVATPVAARDIVRAVARRRREAVITGHGRITVFLQRHVPALVDWVVRRFGVRSRGEPPPAT